MLTILDSVFPEHISREIASFIYLDESDSDKWSTKYSKCIFARHIMHNYLDIIRGLDDTGISMVPNMKAKLKIVDRIDDSCGNPFYPKIDTNMQTQISKHEDSFPEQYGQYNYWYHYNECANLYHHECIMIARSYELSNISSGIHKYLVYTEPWKGSDGKQHPPYSCDICYTTTVDGVNGYYSPICIDCYTKLTSDTK